MIRDLIRHRVLRQPLKVKSLLPDKPSQLILVALADLRWTEKNAAYDVNMDMWHVPAMDVDDTCTVCFAGSVMARSLKSRVDESTGPYDFDSDTEGKLLALNKFRQGRLAQGLDLMDITTPEGFKKNWHVVEYSTDRETFHEDMAIIAYYLDSVGL